MESVECAARRIKRAHENAELRLAEDLLSQAASVRARESRDFARGKPSTRLHCRRGTAFRLKRRSEAM
jgi:hypothetical protein